MKQNHRFSIRAQGNSMFPILQDGDTVEYIQTPFGAVQLNDIILVYVNDILMTHRVIYKTKNTCITRGDNNSAADSAIQKGKVLAKVVRFKRKDVWYGMQDVYLMQSALYLHEIQNLETVLQLQKIPHVFLKGVLISLRYENAIPKRIYADCDILVRRNGQRKIQDAFKTLGYKLQERHLPHQSFRAMSEKSRSVLRFAGFLSRKKLLRNDNYLSKPEVSYVKIVNGVPIVFDVHFEPVFLMTQVEGMNMLYPSKLLAEFGEKIIKNGEVKKIKGFKYSLCSVSDQILYLALHIFHHNYTDSIRYQLLDAVIRKSNRGTRFARSFGSSPQDDWRKLARTIKDYRLEGYVYGVFVLSKKYFKTPIPQSFFTAIRPSSYMLHVTCYIIKHVDIFSQDSRMKAGIERFILIFLLSPNPMWKKFFLFIHPQTIILVGRILWLKIAIDREGRRKRYS